MKTLPITALVASHDEAQLLPRCLRSLAFCDELIVIDIDSRDDTAAVAAAHGARVLRHTWVPIAEYARAELAHEATHDWLLVVDPDEEVSPGLARDLAELLPTLPSDVAVVEVPWRFYFRGRPLHGTIWGGVSRKQALVRRAGVELHTTVHTRTRIRPGYRSTGIEFAGDNALLHHWATGYRALLEKHLRYVKLEGRDRAAAGQVTGVRDVAATPWRSFRTSFVEQRGFRDGATGLGLSLFWAAYSTAAKLALLRELRKDGR